MKRLIVAITLLATTAAAAAAQRVPDLQLVHASGGYGQFGGGFGNFTLACDTGCSGDQLSSSDLTFILGRQFGSRWRLEFGARFQRNTGASSDLFTGSGGVGIYLVKNLFVRGAATYNRVSIEETSGSYEATGGPGFQVGAGYELFIGDRTALTPYVNYVSTSLSTIDISSPGGTSTTAGNVTALTFGVTIGRSPRRTGVCVNQDGQRVVDSHATHQAFVACVADVALWLRNQGRSK